MSGDKVTETKVEPWDKAQPTWMKLLTEGNTAYDATSKDPFGGEYYAGPSDAYRADLGSSRDLYRRTLGGDFLSPESNPFLQGAIDAALRPVQNRLTNDILPMIDDAAISGGAYGGARQGIEQNRALSDFSTAATDTTSRISYDNYLKERQNQQGATGKLLGLGEIEQGWEQGGLAGEYQKWQDQQTAPWNGISQLLSILAGTSGFATTTQTQQSNPIAELLQGLGGGASLISSLFGAAPLAGLLGGAAGVSGLPQ